jgi:hypothetical protein
MNIFNKDFGNRLSGISFCLLIVTYLNENYSILIRILSAIIFMYFITFGNNRFTEDYKKII